MAQLTDFVASADIVGNRVAVAWSWVPDDGDADLGDVPAVRLAGKDLDFAYDEFDDGGVLFDSASFPPAPSDEVRVVPATMLPLGFDGSDRRIETSVTTVASRSADVVPSLAHPDLTEAPDEWIETARLTTRTLRTADGRVVGVRQEFLDVGGLVGLTSHIPRCYRLSIVDRAEHHDQVAVPTRIHGHSRTLYDLLPTAWRREDDAPRGESPSTHQIGAIPESRRDAGQLRRFVDLFGLGTDHLRSRADGLRSLHDVEHVDPRLLPHLAHLVGWELWSDRPIAEHRHAIRYASRLYGLTGTGPGVQLWAKRLTGWDVDIAEFAENVIWSNDPGGEDSPTRSGSTSVDTLDPDVIARLKTGADSVDYTYDTRSTSDAWYSPHTIGVFPHVESDQTAAEVDHRRDRLLAATDRYLPGNLRLVVALPDDPITNEHDVALGASATADELG